MDDERIHALVVEDEPTARRLIQEILKARGHEVEAVPDAESGWTAYLRNRHALVVLDMNLPGMDGIELCRRIREVPESDMSVVVFVTGVTDRKKLEEALEAGADDYMVKPIDAQVPVRLAIAERRVRV